MVVNDAREAQDQFNVTFPHKRTDRYLSGYLGTFAVKWNELPLEDKEVKDEYIR